MIPSLRVVMYHYVRDLPNSRFPRIKGMLIRDFGEQLNLLGDCYEMATLESTLAFLKGSYTPARDLCLLTFDDGLKEHYTNVTPMLLDHGVQGVFFVITAGLEEQRVASVHMNHFLMAALGFGVYRGVFLERLEQFASPSPNSNDVDRALAERTYRWDSPEIAWFKYLFNFVLEPAIRDEVVRSLFVEHIAEEKCFSAELYLSWEEARQMQSAGMIIGGHSHQHKPLAALSDEELHSDLSTCQRLLAENLLGQAFWPFCYPYGKKDSFSRTAIEELKQLGFTCSFSTEIGANVTGTDLFALRRIDCKDAPEETKAVC
jgi:peptidoglycan/xylan/chitin deacetylase (PgdA/CDA1 family)